MPHAAETTTEHLLALANEASPHVALLVDGQGLIVLANPATTRVLGWESSELVGQPIEVLIPRRMREHHREHRASFADEARAMGVGRDLLARCKTGHEIPVEVALNPIATDGASYVLATVVDLSGQREMAERMLAAERLATLGTLAASVAHEVNNPNAFITANLEALRHCLATVEKRLNRNEELAAQCSHELAEARHAVDDSLEGVRRVSAIVAQLRVLTRSPTEQDPRGKLCLNDIVRWACLLVQGRITERATLVLELGESLPRMLGYSGQISQVVTNLLTNALQAIPHGQPTEHRVLVSTDYRDDTLRLVVQDTGAGMDEATRTRAFRKFFTTKPIGEGSGLGLSISRDIVEAHGGTISLGPGPEGRGTRAEVVLPALTTSTEPPADEVRPIDDTGLPRRILVVDDDPAIRRAYRRVLRPHVVVDTDGSGAWQLFSEGDVDFDLVLCDVTMPTLDGPALFKRVQEMWPELSERFVFSTGGAVSPNARALIDAFAGRVLLKPVPRDVLLETLQDVVTGATPEER